MLPVFLPLLERRPSTHSSGCCHRALGIQATGWSHDERSKRPHRGLRESREEREAEVKTTLCLKVIGKEKVDCAVPSPAEERTKEPKAWETDIEACALFDF